MGGEIELFLPFAVLYATEFSEMLTKDELVFESKHEPSNSGGSKETEALILKFNIHF